jgi:hypothetical protein
MPGLTLERELCLLKPKIQNLKNFISDYEKQELEFVNHILLRTLNRDLFKLIMLKFDLEQRIEDFMNLQNDS